VTQGVWIFDEREPFAPRGIQWLKRSGWRAAVRLLEEAVGELPETFRTVFVLREVEGLSSEETADILGVPVATVKTRLFRGRRRLQEMLQPELGSALTGTFPFAGADCAALTARVLERLGL
jgi:RNA polymerase sigma-70 factor, ECF subfamily